MPRWCIGDEAQELVARIHGFMGLIAHLSGEIVTKALQLYQSAIEVLSKFEAWRGLSIFSRHMSDLLRGMNELSEARTNRLGPRFQQPRRGSTLTSFTIVGLAKQISNRLESAS